MKVPEVAEKGLIHPPLASDLPSLQIRSVRFPGARIVLAHEDSSTRNALRSLLRAHYRLELTDTVVETLRAARREPPDLILANPRLGTNEPGFLQTLRSDPSFYNVPVIFLLDASTAMIGNSLSEADDFIVRPFHLGELVARIDGALLVAKTRRQANAALEEAERRFRLISQASEDRLQLVTKVGKVGVWDWDVAENRLFWTDSVFRLHGVKKGEFDVTVEGFVSLIHPDDRNYVMQAIQNALQKDEPYEIEFRVIHPDGKIVWLFTNAIVIREEGKPVRMLGATMDVTIHKQTEVALRESKDRYRYLIESLPAAVYTTDINGHILLYNEAAKQMWGRDPKKEAGRWCGSYKMYRTDGTPLNPESCPMAVSLKEGRCIRGEEVVIERPNGTRLHILPHPQLVRDSSGKIIGGINMLIDITDRKAAERNLEKIAEDLSRSNKELEEFAYVASHDLREPLHVVSTFSDLLERRAKETLDDDSKRYIQFIRDGIFQARTLIRELLEYSRIGQEKSFEPVDIASVIKETMNHMKISIQKYEARIRFGKLPVIRANRIEMGQLFQNLISNSIKYRSKRTPDIRISFKETNLNWIFSVKDNGIGIDKEFHERVFAMFQRLHSKSDHSGSGIGLAICKKIIEHHGGKIWLESKRGRGTTFHFTISRSLQ